MSQDDRKIADYIRLVLEDFQSRSDFDRERDSYMMHGPYKETNTGDPLSHKHKSEYDRDSLAQFARRIDLGREAKIAFNRYADRNFLNSLITIHWGRRGSESIEEMLESPSYKSELSCQALLPDATNEEILEGNAWGRWGLQVKGHITLLANSMDDLHSMSHTGYSQNFPERTRDSGANKGVLFSPLGNHLVFDRSDWNPRPAYGEGPNNEALVDNWRPIRLLYKGREPKDIKMGYKLAQKHDLYLLYPGKP